jgi:hypothetical protein
MRFILVMMLVVASVAAAGAQGGAQEKPKTSDDVLRQRLLLKERFNKSWDVQLENARDRIEGRCKAEAKRRYSALHPIKRRQFAKDCIERAGR